MSEPTQYRYRCRNCESVRLYRRVSTWPTEFEEHTRSMGGRHYGPSDEEIKRWRCRRCGEKMHDHERLDTAESGRTDSFRYGGETDFMKV